MRYYPVNLDIQDRRCLVLGGGAVGTRKVLTLLNCGARVTIVSPEATERLADLSEDQEVLWKQRTYRSADLDGMFLVIGATDDETLNHRIYEDAKRLNILCNIADRPEVCNFILPAIVNRGDLIIAISTSGKSPAFAKQLRLEMADRFGEEYAEFLTLMGAIRKQLLKEDHAPEAHKPIFEQLIFRGLIDLMRNEDRPGIDSLLEEILGNEYDYDQLMGSESESR